MSDSSVVIDELPQGSDLENRRSTTQQNETGTNLLRRSFYAPTAVRFRVRTRNQAISKDVQEFRAPVLVIRGQGRRPESVADRAQGSAPVYSGDSGGYQTHGPAARSDRAVGDHAAASIGGQIPHAADRFAVRRARRAAAARDVRSAGTASPVPKYISSGVCPRNAECGSTWLCS